MTRAQIEAIDRTPDGATVSVRILGRGGMPVAEIRGGTFLQRPVRAPAIAWMVALPGCNINLYEADRATHAAGEITVRL